MEYLHNDTDDWPRYRERGTIRAFQAKAGDAYEGVLADEGSWFVVDDDGTFEIVTDDEFQQTFYAVIEGRDEEAKRERFIRAGGDGLDIFAIPGQTTVQDQLETVIKAGEAVADEAT